MAKLLLSAAHTIDAPGQIHGDLKEAELTRKILKLCVPYLEKKQIEFKTVPLDLNLLDRIDWINKSGFTEDDIFIEIHINDGGKRGLEAWFSGQPGTENKSQTLAEFILDDLSKRTGFQNQKAKSELEHDFGQLIILNQTKPTSISLELLYIDNPEDIKILSDEKKLDQLAKDLVDTIEAYLKLTKSELEALRKKQESREIKKKSFSYDNFDFDDDLLPTSLKTTTSTNSTQTQNSSGTSDKTTSSSSTKIMDRDERKKMIIDTYKKIFGDEPETTKVNTFLNQGVSEEELIKKLIDSDDYKKMLEEYLNYQKNKDEFKNVKTELELLKKRIQDTEAMLANLKKLLEHKKALISRLRYELTVRGITMPGEFLDYNTPPAPLQTSDNSQDLQK